MAFISSPERPAKDSGTEAWSFQISSKSFSQPVGAAAGGEVICFGASAGLSAVGGTRAGALWGWAAAEEPSAGLTVASVIGAGETGRVAVSSGRDRSTQA